MSLNKKLIELNNEQLDYLIRVIKVDIIESSDRYLEKNLNIIRFI